MNSFFFRSMIGIFFGAFIAVMTTSALIYFGGQSEIDGLLFIKNAFGYIFCGWLFTVTPLYFKIRSLGLPMQTALHFLTVTIGYLIISLLIGWIRIDVKNFMIFLAIAILFYAIAWIVSYLYFKNESKKLNKDLRRH
ncbi:DUF3021 domain-containing protein [Paenibacillus nasutitermitis]|uniref:DUF3021 domain-containing protein n=1 Tax=Paenibacillus nasutitermitis TaxID=1652958 RepID=A0A916YTB6_9BACL|nr:DUF3021 domain-containing protein [Paenibacillus nasutitermitis]GGD60549.1 hypothetical protein GCM10010911_18040 [Paenibacillus nasutitermitis]